MNTNWTDDLTLEQQQDCYHEIVDYFTNEVVKEVLEKYDNALDFDSLSV
jgi:GTP1/Obg family GTP-binding protein